MSNEMTESRSVAESRQQRRFTASKPIIGFLGGSRFVVLNLSGGGMQIEHSDPMKIGSAGEIRIETDGEPPFAVMGRIVWSRLSRQTDAKGKFQYRSGVAIVDADPSLIGALGRLIRAAARPDTGSLERKRQSIEQKRQSSVFLPVTVIRPAAAIPTLPCLEVVREARKFLASHPEEAAKWLSRARYSLANAQGYRAPTPPQQHALAIWEYLGGKVEIGDIAAAVDLLNDQAREG